MPTSLAIILGLAGAVLIVIGAIGGGFTISTTSVPTIRMLPRVICFAMGAALLVTSIIVFNKEIESKDEKPPIAIVPVPPQAAGGVVINMQQPPPMPASDGGSGNSGGYMSVTAPITAPSGYDVNLYGGLDTSAVIVARLPDNYQVEIICTAEGQSVTRPDGVTSSLWDGVSVGGGVGGFVPDVYVVTQTSQPTMPNCATI